MDRLVGYEPTHGGSIPSIPTSKRPGATVAGLAGAAKSDRMAGRPQRPTKFRTGQ
jgi:hypothetical protein